MPALAIFPLGLAIGSFITVVAHRVPRGLSVVGPRSQCPGCGATIAAYDNIPVLSYLWLRGRSRCCGQPISARYPLAELSVGLLFVALSAVLSADPMRLILALMLSATLVAVTLTDLERRIIPNRILAVAAIGGLAVIASAEPASLPRHLAAAAAGGGLLLAAALARPGGMGMGDVKLAVLMGLYLGWSVAPALLAAFLVGGVVGLVQIARHGAAARKRALPFGPFLALGGLVGLLAGPELLDLYLGTFSH